MSNPTYIPSADAAREGYLTADEVRELQAICNRFRSVFYIIGSRALGEGRNIHQKHLPVGKGPGTRSDIDVRIEGDDDIRSQGMLSHAIASVSGNAGNARPLFGLPAPPAIIFRPQ